MGGLYQREVKPIAIKESTKGYLVALDKKTTQ
jgi:hypothetical protein